MAIESRLKTSFTLLSDLNLNRFILKDLFFVYKKNGVDYFELRCLDLQPLSPLGLEIEQACFLELMFLFCLLLPSPPLEKIEWQELNYNQEIV